MKTSKTIGIIGGAFNPIHFGHLSMAKIVVQYVDQVWLQPCYKHMHDKEMENDEHRLNMVDIALEDELNIFKKRRKIIVSDYEIRNKLEICTFDVLMMLKQEFPENEFQLVMGQDNADSIENWKKSEELISTFPIIVLPRKHTGKVKSWYHEDPHLFLNKPQDNQIINVSSTEIRKKIPYILNAERGHWGSRVLLTPRPVEDYIMKNRCYFPDECIL